MIARNRQVVAGRVANDQADLFSTEDGFSRVEGITLADLNVRVFFNNALQGHELVSGVGVTDGQVLAGSVYFHEIVAGYYALRFIPTTPGAWRVILNCPDGAQSQAVDFDASATPLTPSGTLHASFG